MHCCMVFADITWLAYPIYLPKCCDVHYLSPIIDNIPHYGYETSHVSSQDFYENPWFNPSFACQKRDSLVL